MSPASCAEVVRQHLEAVGSRFSCSERDGRLWVVSPYLYPDGDYVEASIRELSTGEAVVSDLGETLRHLSTHGFDPRLTSKGEYLLAEITKQHNVSLERGMISKRVLLSDAGTALQDVLTAALSISHLLYLSRGYRPATFLEEVGQLITGLGIGFDPHHFEVGRVTEKRYPINFFVPGQGKDALIQALSPTTRAGSIPTVNATFRLWSDVQNGRWRATLIDDRTVEWRPEDVLLLRGVSEVHLWSERPAFEAALVGAVGQGRKK